MTKTITTATQATTPAAPTTAAPPTAGTRVFVGKLHRARGDRGAVAFSEEPPAPPPEPVRRPACVARTLALAHRLEAAITRGEYKDRAALARDAGLTRARVTQLMDLTLIAPDIQEEVLGLEAVNGAEPLSVRALQAICRAETWVEQRAAWRRRVYNEGRGATA